MSKKEYPSLELGYQFVFHSYDWMLKRLEAVEDRIQRLLVYGTTITVGFPVVIASLYRDGNLIGGWHGILVLLAFAFFLKFMALCLLARLWGKIAFPNVGEVA